MIAVLSTTHGSGSRGFLGNYTDGTVVNVYWLTEGARKAETAVKKKKKSKQASKADMFKTE